MRRYSSFHWFCSHSVRPNVTMALLAKYTTIGIKHVANTNNCRYKTVTMLAKNNPLK